MKYNVNIFSCFFIYSFSVKILLIKQLLKNSLF